MQTSRRSRKDTNRSLIQVLVALICALVVAGCAPSAASSVLYIVQRGDTLAKIAAANDTTVEKLVELNVEAYPSLESNPGAIEVGWELKVPSSSGGIQVTIKKTPSLGSGPTVAPLDRGAFEMEVVRLVNEERVKAGLAPLEVDPGLMEFARERSEDMVKRGYFGHNDPATGEILAHRARAGENINKNSVKTSYSAHLAKRFVDSWMGSDGHRGNILAAKYKRTGVGVALGEYVVIAQLFAE
jgi:uncharacterized protein YkwD